MPDSEANSGAPATPSGSQAILDRTILIAFASLVVLGGGASIVTVDLARLVTDETISLLFLVGAAVVLAGVYTGALMPGKIAAAAPGDPKDASQEEDKD